MVGKLSGATATSQSPDGSTPSTLCRGSGGAAVFLVLSGRKASVYPKDKKFSWMAKHEDRLYSQFSAQNTDRQTKVNRVKESNILLFMKPYLTVSDTKSKP